MREQLEQRVRELKAEQHKGHQMLAELESREAELRQNLLRINGAIQVLEEMLAGPAVQNGTLSARRTFSPGCANLMRVDPV